MNIRELIREMIREELDEVHRYDGEAFHPEEDETEEEPPEITRARQIVLNPGSKGYKQANSMLQKHDKDYYDSIDVPNPYEDDWRDDDMYEMLNKLRETTVYKNKCR